MNRPGIPGGSESLAPFEMAGTSVPAIHVQLHTEATGSGTLQSDVNLWLHHETGLVLRRAVELEASSAAPVGTTTYREHYEIILRSLEPHR